MALKNEEEIIFFRDFCYLLLKCAGSIAGMMTLMVHFFTYFASEILLTYSSGFSFNVKVGLCLLNNFAMAYGFSKFISKFEQNYCK
jgi:hypothetical protein